MEHRLRVGLEAWLPLQLRAEALGRWRERTAARHATRDRLQGATLLWRAGALHHAMSAFSHSGESAAPPRELLSSVKTGA